MYIGDYLAKRDLYSPDSLAIVDSGKNPEWRLTYRQMNERANRFANWLVSAGIHKDDRVAILARDGVEHLDNFFACSKLGAIHTALNWRLTAHELAGIFAKITPAILIYSDDFKETVRGLLELVEGTPAAPRVILHIEMPGLPGSRHFETELQNSLADAVRCDTQEAEDIAALLFTGGTTGLPKAAQISHRMIAWNTLNTFIHDLNHGDMHVNGFPMFHTGGLFVYTLPLVIFGGTTVLVRQFDPARVLGLIEREKATVYAGVPTMYQMLMSAPNWKDVDLSTLRICTSGGAPLPIPLAEQYMAQKGVRIKQGFGMTEFGPGIFALALEDTMRKLGSIGRPNYFIEARILDELGNSLGAEQIGELVLKGPSMCSGYFNDPVATRAAVDANGFFHTGDLARYDRDGYFYIVDRKKDMYISGGENVYPSEIEKLLYRHPAVHMCAVVGVPHPVWGEVGVACVVLKPGVQSSEDELLGTLKDQIASYKIPVRVVFMESFPLSAAGKILKRELREIVQARP